ncbi:MAG: ExbD/TolR family protein [bacterium]
MRFIKKNADVQNIDISPLIDVVFILLIFFMVSTTFVKDLQLDIDRPSASSANRASSKVIRVAIDKNSAVYVDNQPVKIWAVQSKLRDLLRQSTEKTVLVITDEGVPVKTLVNVVDEARLSGAKEVAVATNKEAG